MRDAAHSCSRRAASILEVMAAMAVVTCSLQESPNGTNGSCLVSAPDRGNLGDCPQSLPSGAACQPGCPSGYDLSGQVQCEDGNLSAVTCLPSSCSMHEAPEPINGMHGPQCPEVLKSGQTCEPVCDPGWSLTTFTNCTLGTLIPGRCVRCPVGKTLDLSSSSCEECPRNTYKAEPGNSPCLPCPAGSAIGNLQRGADSWNRCICNSSTYRLDEAVGPEPFNCVPCPEHSRTLGVVEARRIEDCRCEAPYMPNLSSHRCRLPYSCNLAEWLANANLTGPEPGKLQIGTCAEFVINNDTRLPSGKACLLSCKPGTSAQVKADLFSAVKRDIACEDGVITGPPLGTWCSEASWTVPPLVFLSAVTIAAGVAMLNIEWRQKRFEDSCYNALSNRTANGQGATLYGTKCKMA